MCDAENSNAIRRPVVEGSIEDWEALEALLHYSMYEQLGWKMGEEGAFIAVEPALTSRDNRERLVQLMFEVFNVASYFATDTAVASLYSIGKHSGLVVDFGYEKTDVIPVIEGVAHPSAAARIPCGGKHVDMYARQLLESKGISCSEQDAERIKKSSMKISPSAMLQNGPRAITAGQEESNDSLSKKSSMTLPDGQVVEMHDLEGLKLGEILIRPSLLGLDVPPLAETMRAAGMVTTIQGEREARKALAESVFLCGGGSQVPGMSERVLADARAIAHPGLFPSLATVPEYMPHHTAARAAWMGGAVLAKFALGDTKPNAPQHMISKADYEEYGPLAVHRKCS